jgi:hypothetical protein
MDMLCISKTVPRPLQKIRIWATATCVGCAMGGHVLQAASATDTAPGKRAGYYALDLEAPSAGTRGKCVAIGISTLGVPQHGVWLVARLPNRLPGKSRSASEAIKVVPVAALRASRVDVCLDEVHALSKASGDDMPVSLELALFASDGPAPAPRNWSAPEYDSLRLSDWVYLPAPVWKFKTGPAGAR